MAGCSQNNSAVHYHEHLTKVSRTIKSVVPIYLTSYFCAAHIRMPVHTIQFGGLLGIARFTDYSTCVARGQAIDGKRESVDL
jgi:hypothetical protein